jgi:gliding motility-associated lipoprotein GldH
MRLGHLLFFFILVLTGCDQNRVYHEYVDFNERYWLTSSKPEFTFKIEDAGTAYNIYCNIRNSTEYPFSRLFVNFSLADTAGHQLQQKLLNEFLFEAKSGKPLGKSGLGDLYDHEFLLLKNYKFNQGGAYKIQFEQYMRTDTLKGIVSVGLAIEKATD